MKRIISLCFALLILLLVSPVNAIESVNTTLFSSAQRPDSVAAEGDSLWAMTKEGLWQWTLGDTEPRLLATTGGQDVGLLLTSSGQLYGLNLQSGAFNHIKVENDAIIFKPLQTFDKSTLLDADGLPRMVKNSLMTADGIFLLLEGGVNSLYELLWLNTKNGSIKTFQTQGLHSIAPYKNDSLLALQAKDEGSKPALVELNLKNEKIKVLIKATEGYGADGLAYDACSKTVYYVVGGTIYAHTNFKKAQTVGYLPAAFVYLNPMIMKEHLVFHLQDGVVVRNLSLDKGNAPTVRVFGLGNDIFLLNKVRSMVPDIRIEAPEGWLTATELAQAVVTGSFNYDVALLNGQSTQLSKLMDKGYLMDLSPYAETARVMKRLYPVFLTPVQKDGATYGLPSGVTMSSYGYQQHTLDAIGMKSEELPRDILSFIDFIASWRDRPDALTAGIAPSFDLTKRFLLESMAVLYVEQHQMRNLPLSFDTPLFHQMMDKINNLDEGFLRELSELSQSNLPMRSAVIGSNYDLRMLTRKRPTYAEFFWDFDPLSIALEPGMDTLYPFSATYALMMQGAKNPEAAARVIAAISEADWAQENAPILFADYQPIVSNNALENLEAIKQHARYIEAQIKKAKGAEKSNLEQQLKEQNQEIAKRESNMYVATMDEVEAYRREVLPFLRPAKPSLMYDWNNLEDLTFFKLFRQFVDGAITAEQFIAEADRVLQMMESERR